MNLPHQISQAMSLREPQREALEVLDAISDRTEYKSASLDQVAQKATEVSRDAKPVKFDTAFPSFCFALATGVGKTRLMGASIYYLWKSKGYKNFFILAPNITIYDKLRAELAPSHPKYMFVGLEGFPQPAVFDGDNYLRFSPGQRSLYGEANIFVFNISKIFKRGDVDFKFHQFQEELGESFSAMLREMDDLVILMDESHRYRAPASINAINHLRPVLGLEYSATPKNKDCVVYSFTLAQAMGRFIKTPTVVTRTNLTTSDEQEIVKLKLLDGMALHEAKKARLAEYCFATGLPTVKPFVLVSTKDTDHAKAVREQIESVSFYDGRYRDKVIEIHSNQTGAESDENIQRLLSVENPSNTVEVVVHVNMLKEGWDVKNLYTIIPLRASISEILTEQTIGRGLRLPFGDVTGDEQLDALEIISHDNYAKLIEASKGNPLFRVRELNQTDTEPRRTVTVQRKALDADRILDRVQLLGGSIFTTQLSNNELAAQAVAELVQEDAAAYEIAVGQEPAAATGTGLDAATGEHHEQEKLFVPDEVQSKQPVFNPEKQAQKYKQQLEQYLQLVIDVPQIYVDTIPQCECKSFDIKVNYGPFELVEQRIIETDLSNGEERLGEVRDVAEVREPEKFLAGLLLESIDEWSPESDKNLALDLVRKYIALMNTPAENLGKIVYLYRQPIIRDIQKQVEEHLNEKNIVSVSVRKTPFRWPTTFPKSIYANAGTVDYKEDVPGSRIRGYLFTGFQKSMYSCMSFDSNPERILSAVLERDVSALRWVRPPENCLNIRYRGHQYTPDFIIQTADRKYIVEVKSAREIGTPEVREKAAAAKQWCDEASKVPGEPKWEYRLVSEEAVSLTADLKFILSQAVML